MTVSQGDVVVILRPSGPRKTAFLRSLSYPKRANAEELILGGKTYGLIRISHKNVLEICEKAVFVFQNYNLFANKTTIENTLEGLAIAHETPKEEVVPTTENALKKTGFLEKKDYYPSQLSDGRQQRTGIARAIAVRPDVILFDKPMPALDSELTGDAFDAMRELTRGGATMAVVIHEMSFARDVATHVVFMEGGHIIEEGDPKEFFSRSKEGYTKQLLTRIIPELNTDPMI